jgi:dienelactone hydrolase
VSRHPTTAGLGAFADLVDLARATRPLFGEDRPSPGEIDRRLRSVLGVLPQPPLPDVTEHARWSRDGIEGVELSWETGFGPRAGGWLLRPAGETAALPGVLALHCHGGMKFFGKEKIADGPSGTVPPSIAAYREEYYDGRAVANELARAGHTVLAHDVFGWGSRRVPTADMPAQSERIAALDREAASRAGLTLTEADRYDIHAGAFEDKQAKAIGVLGTSWAGLIAREDILAIDALSARPETIGDPPAAVGFSGGGARATLLSALSDRVGATVVIGMMSTLADLVDSHLHQHSWTLMSPGLGTVADLPDIAGARAPRPLFVGYGTTDPLFPLDGMRAAHAALTERYTGTGAYRGVFRDAPHRFDAVLQAEVIRFLRDVLPVQSAVPTTAGVAAGPPG